MKIKTLVAASLVSMALAGAANASFIYTGSGTAGDGRPENGSATFDFQSLTHLVITLENTGGVGEVGGISSSLTGIIFGFSSPAPSGGTLNAAGTSAAGAVDCTSGAVTCTSAPVPAAPFGWTLTGTSTMSLAAGAGSFKPYGIMNNNVTGNTDGVSNPEHNNWLIGPVVFDITLTGLTSIPTSFSSVIFNFGTSGDTQTGTSSTSTSTSTSTSGRGASGEAPEPSSSSLALLGIAMLAVTFLRRQKARSV